jgi:hypothetical protein
MSRGTKDGGRDVCLHDASPRGAQRISLHGVSPCAFHYSRLHGVFPSNAFGETFLASGHLRVLGSPQSSGDQSNRSLIAPDSLPAAWAAGSSR